MRRCLIRYHLTAFLAIGVFSANTFGADKSLVFGGAEFASKQGYVYLGTLTPLADSTMGNGWMWRNWIDWLSYQYDANVRIKASAVGYTPALVRQFSNDSTSVGISVGLRMATTHLSPDDPGNDNRGFRTGVPIQIDMDQRLGTRTALVLIASKDVNHGNYWSRVRLLHSLAGSGYTVGPEVVWKGGHEFHASQIGAVLGNLPVSDKGRLVLKAGYTRQDGVSSGAYSGIELVHPF